MVRPPSSQPAAWKTKFVPARIPAIMLATDSCMAWPSATLEAVRWPPQRSGRPSRRQSWAMAKVERLASGVPKVGAPVFRFMVVRKLP